MPMPFLFTVNLYMVKLKDFNANSDDLRKHEVIFKQPGSHL